MINQIPGIWDYYAKLVRNNIDQHHGFDLKDIFNTIAAIDTDESVKLIGPYLFNPLDPMKFAAPGFHFNTVSGSAMQALHKMDLPDSPTKGQRSPGGSGDVRLWQNWWKENAHRYIEAAVAPDEAAALKPSSNSPAVKETPPALTPPGTPAPLILTAEPPRPNWYPLIAAVALLLALGLYFQFRRRDVP